jgi:hypothetical protein
MYYQLSSKGTQYKPGELPRSAERVLVVFEPNSPADTAQVAKALHKPKADIENLLNYLTTQGFLTTVEVVPKPKAIVKPKGLGLHSRTIKQLVKQELKERKAQKKWGHSEKGKKSRSKYEHSEGGVNVRQKYQHGPKYKAAYERWRCKLRLSPKGLAMLQDKKWTPLHDLLAFVHLNRPAKEQLKDEDFNTLRSNGYI